LLKFHRLSRIDSENRPTRTQSVQDRIVSETRGRHYFDRLRVIS
jgi:hypothetical protein